MDTRTWWALLWSVATGAAVIVVQPLAGDLELEPWHSFVLIGAIIFGAYLLGRHHRKTGPAFVLEGTTTLSKVESSRWTTGQWTIICLVVRNTGAFRKHLLVKVKGIQDQKDGRYILESGYLKALRTEQQREADMAARRALGNMGRFTLGYDEVANVVLACGPVTGPEPPTIQWYDGGGMVLERHRAVYVVTVALCGRTTTRYKVKLWVDAEGCIHDKDPNRPA